MKNTLEENKEELNAILQSPNQSPDPFLALGAIPGTGMSDPKGKWLWEQPPQFTDPDEAVDLVMEQFEKDANKVNVLKLLTAGVSVEEMVNITMFNAFTQGKFSPDIAELIKPAITVGIIKMAGDENVPFRLYSDEIEDTEMPDKEVFKIMQSRNPEIYKGIREDINAQIRAGKNPRPVKRQPIQKPLSEKGFLEIGAQE